MLFFDYKNKICWVAKNGGNWLLCNCTPNFYCEFCWNSSAVRYCVCILCCKLYVAVHGIDSIFCVSKKEIFRWIGLLKCHKQLLEFTQCMFCVITRYAILIFCCPPSLPLSRIQLFWRNCGTNNSWDFPYFHFSSLRMRNNESLLSFTSIFEWN